jgi:plasmid stabilization system protein ParE
LLKQVDWYRQKAGPEVAEGDVNTVEATLQTLADNPGLGRPRFPRWRELAGIGDF